MDEIAILEDRIKILENQIFKLTGGIHKKKSKMTYNKFNLHSESERIEFLIGRDGLYSANQQLKALKGIYLNASLGTRKIKSGINSGRNHPFRYKFVEAAFNIRRYLKNDLCYGVRLYSNK